MEAINQELEYLFNARSVAVVGASNTPGKWGFNIINRLLASNCQRKIYAINRSTSEVRGLKTYQKVTEVPEPIDLVVIAVPFPYVPEVMQDCVEKGVKAAVVISAGLGEKGGEGIKVEQEIVRVARSGGIRFVGPNCMGHFNTASDLYTTGFIPPVRKGSVGLIAQSGAFAIDIVGRGLDMGVGFSKLVGSGNEADLHLEDYLEYLAGDEETKVITAYIEGLREGRRFLKLAKEITRRKPIVVMKVGRTSIGSKAARSHTGALSGSDAVYDVAFEQAGVIRVNEVEELFDVATALVRQPLPKGRRVGMLCGGGGQAVIATDACQRLGLEIASLSQATIQRLNSILPARWPHANPVDMVAAEDFVTYRCLWPLIEDENVDAVLAVGCIGVIGAWRERINQIPVPPEVRERILERLSSREEEELASLDLTFERIDEYHKPLIISLAVDEAVRVSAVFKKLQGNGLSIYSTSERAVKVLAHLVWYGEYLSQ